MEGVARRNQVVCGVLVAVGAAAHLFVMARSRGSADMKTWEIWSDLGNSLGLKRLYTEYKWFNHPPLSALMVMALRRITRENAPFTFLFKVPLLLSCGLATFLLWRERSPRAAAAFALSPLVVAVSAYHGNTDALLAGLTLLACVLFDHERWLWAGLTLGAAINVKIVPVLVLPALLFALPAPRAAVRFLGGLAVASVPFLIALTVVGRPFFTNLFLYNSNFDRWGLPLLVVEFAPDWRAFFEGPWRWVLMALLAAVGFATRRWKLAAAHRVALAWALFLVLTPGFSIQYLIWLAPALVFSAPIWGTVFGVLGGAYAIAIYVTFSTPAERWYSDFQDLLPHPGLGLLTWGVLAAFAGATLARARFQTA